ncbi:MAG TPA: sugar phosphate nucleotidyltransferase [Pirellulaceae bacterium]|nr:sugar phosphate nucleotidyltransferase [Pirellulaceae bacterium]
MDRVRQAIIPAAGWGTRLLPLSHAVPKELLPIGRKPALQWIAEELADAGIEHLILVANPSKLPVERLFQSDRRLEASLTSRDQSAKLGALWSHGPYASVRVSVTYQEQQLGLGHAVACGRSQLGPGPFAVALGDSLIGPPGTASVMARLLAAFESHRAAAAIAFENVAIEQVSQYGIAHPGSDDPVFELHDIVEKPSMDQAPSRLAVAARYVFSEDIFHAIDATPRGVGGEFQLTDAIRNLIRAGQRVVGVRLTDDEQRFDVGSYESYCRAILAYMDYEAAVSPRGTGL